MEAPRNVLIKDVIINYAKLETPVENPFSKAQQYEMQIATTDAAKAQEMRDAHLNVKEKDGVFSASLKRNAFKKDGGDNGKVRVVNENKQPIESTRDLGNGSEGNVILWQYPYQRPGTNVTAIASSLTAVQITKYEVYEGQNSVDFDVVGGAEASEEAATELF